MADRVENVIWRLTIDDSQLSEFERRLASVKRQQKEVESSGTQDVGKAVNASNQRTRALDNETAAIDRQSRAVNALSAAKQRAGIGGIGPRFGTGIHPTNTGQMYGPAYDIRGGAVPWAEQPARRAWIGNINRAIAERYAAGGGGISPAVDAINPVYAAMAARAAANPAPAGGGGHVPMWASPARSAFNPAWIDQQLRYAPTRLGTTPGGLQYMRTPPGQPSYLPGGFGDPRGRLDGPAGFNGLSSVGGVSPGAMAYANQAARGRMFFPNTFAGGPGAFAGSMNVLSNLGTAFAGGALAMDPNVAPMTRMSGGIAAGLNVAQAYGAYRYGGGAQALRQFAGSTLGRASLIAAPVAIGLEGARQYYQGEANYQAQIGQQYDWKIAMNNLQRDQRTARADLRGRHRETRLDFYRDFKDMQFQRGASLIGERASFNSAIAGTRTDTAERIQVQREQVGAALANQQRVQRNLERARSTLASAKTPEAKRSAQREVQQWNDRLAASSQEVLGLQSGIQGDAAGLVSQRDAMRQRFEEWESGLEPLDKTTHAYRQHRGKALDAIAEADRAVRQAGIEGMTADKINAAGGAAQRDQIEQARQATIDSRNAGDQATYSEGMAKINEDQLTELKTLNTNFEKLIEALTKQKPKEPEREGINKVVHESPVLAGGLAGAGGIGVGFITGGE